MTELPAGREIRRLSPSRADALRACPLKVAFAQQAAGPSRSSDPARLGSICHAVLEGLVKEGAAASGTWPQRLDSIWSAELKDDAYRNPGLGPPRRWALALARMANVLRRLERVLADLPPDAELCPEVDLISTDGLLAGRADLVVRSSSGSIIVDYKTGAVTDRASGELRDSYARQLKLYAYLEHQATEAWPARGILIPFDGDPVEVVIDPVQCEALADDARAALAAYNAAVPGAPPARPAPATCAWCDAAAICPAFWEACDPDWASEGVNAGRGPTEFASVTPMGGLTLRFESTQGSLRGATNVHAIDVRAQLEAAPRSQEVVALAGLRANRAPDTYVPGPHLRMAIERS